MWLQLDPKNFLTHVSTLLVKDIGGVSISKFRTALLSAQNLKILKDELGTHLILKLVK